MRSANSGKSQEVDSLWKLLRSVQGGDKDYQRLLESIQSIFHADGCSLFLEREADHVFILHAQTGTSADIPEDAEIRPGEGIAGAALADQIPMLVGDPHDTPNLRKRSTAKRQEIGSSIVVPLIVPSNGAVGVLNLSRGQGSKQFDQNDVDLVTALASNLALIFENALLVRKLYRSHSALSQVMQAVEIGTCVFEADGKLRTLNIPAGIWLMGSAQTWADLIGSLPPELGHAASECVNQTRNVGDTHSMVVEIEGKTLRTTVVRLTGGGIAWTLQDQTEHFNMIKEAGRLQRLAEIGQMTAAVAHDIRNPLTSISGAVKLIEECPERVGELTEIIQEEIDKLSGLCDEFLNFARPLMLRFSREKIVDLLVRVAALEGFSRRQSGVELMIDSDPGLGELCIDRDRIEQVAKNLVQNAVQASLPGNIVTLKAIQNGFSITDEGCGMTDEVFCQLFMPFQTTKPRGTGLGLCNVKKIVDAHGGHIDVERLAKGTRFTVLLPHPKNDPCSSEN